MLYDFPELVFLFCLFCLESADSRPSTNCELAGTEKGADAAGDVEFCDYRWGKCIKITTSASAFSGLLFARVSRLLIDQIGISVGLHREGIVLGKSCYGHLSDQVIYS